MEVATPHLSTELLDLDSGTKGLSRVRRPQNAFILFSNRHRADVAKEFPGLSNHGVSRVLGSQWKALTVEQKKLYEEMAAEGRRLHKLEHPDFDYNKARKLRHNVQLQQSPTPSIQTGPGIISIPPGPPLPFYHHQLPNPTSSSFFAPFIDSDTRYHESESPTSDNKYQSSAQGHRHAASAPTQPAGNNHHHQQSNLQQHCFYGPANWRSDVPRHTPGDDLRPRTIPYMCWPQTQSQNPPGPVFITHSSFGSSYGPMSTNVPPMKPLSISSHKEPDSLPPPRAPSSFKPSITPPTSLLHRNSSSDGTHPVPVPAPLPLPLPLTLPALVPALYGGIPLHSSTNSWQGHDTHPCDDNVRGDEGAANHHEDDASADEDWLDDMPTTPFHESCLIETRTTMSARGAGAHSSEMTSTDTSVPMAMSAVRSVSKERQEEQQQQQERQRQWQQERQQQERQQEHEQEECEVEHGHGHGHQGELSPASGSGVSLDSESRSSSPAPSPRTPCLPTFVAELTAWPHDVSPTAPAPPVALVKCTAGPILPTLTSPPVRPPRYCPSPYLTPKATSSYPATASYLSSAKAAAAAFASFGGSRAAAQIPLASPCLADLLTVQHSPRPARVHISERFTDEGSLLLTCEPLM